MKTTLTHRALAPLALALALFLLPSPASAAAACANGDLVPNAGNAAKVRSATLCLINRQRTRRGLRRLRANRHLRKVAEGYSRQMVSHGFFAHVGNDGSTLKSRILGSTKYLVRAASWSLGENLYWGSGERATPEQSVSAWMKSPGHRRNMLDRKFRDIGIGIALGAPQDVGGSPAATYTTEFGRRASRRARR